MITFTCILNSKKRFPNATPLSKTCDNFRVSFWGENIVNIFKKTPKQNFNNNFIRNLNISFKRQNQIQRMPHSFKVAVTIFECNGGKNAVKTEHNLKNIWGQLIEGYRNILKPSCRPLAFDSYKAFLKDKKESGSLPATFLHDFWRRIFLFLNSVNWASFIAWLSLLRKMCICAIFAL